MKIKYKILVVDDEEDFLETIAKRLNKEGLDVETAGNCTDAFLKLEEQRPDIVLLDVKMPKMDGIQCLKKIKTNWPATQVIMLTGHASVNTSIEGMKLGAFDYCLKPFDLEELIMKIELAYENITAERR